MDFADITYRQASTGDLPAIVAMLADDILGEGRECLSGVLSQSYIDAFAELQASNTCEIIVLEHDGQVIGTMQLSYLPGLSLQGTKRCQIEGVRIAAAVRGLGLGAEMIRWAIERGKARGCGLAQLTSNRARDDALRFYEKLGFVPSHIGFKLQLQ